MRYIDRALAGALADQDDLRAVAKNLMAFFADESCGQCTPCRVGTEKMLGLLERDEWDADQLQRLAQRAHQQRLAEAGDAFKQAVPARQQADQQLLHHI